MYKPTSTNVLSNVHGGLYERTAQFSQTIAAESFEIPASWEDLEYRQATLEAEIEQGIAWQVRINREERGWTQRELGTRLKTGQSAISKLESPEGGDIQLSTLVKAAHAFDCALLVRFVSYSEFRAVTADVQPDRLIACGFVAEKTQPKFISKNGDISKTLLNTL